jgi:hypothetical protein
MKTFAPRNVQCRPRRLSPEERAIDILRWPLLEIDGLLIRIGRGELVHEFTTCEAIARSRQAQADVAVLMLAHE